MSTMAHPTQKWAIFDNGLVRPIPDGEPVTRDMFPHIKRDWYVAARPLRPHVRVDPRGPQDPKHMVGQAGLSEREDWPYALEVSPGSLIEEPRVVVIPTEEYRREYIRDGRPARPDYDWERRQREKARRAGESASGVRPDAALPANGAAAQAIVPSDGAAPAASGGRADARKVVPFGGGTGRTAASGIGSDFATSDAAMMARTSGVTPNAPRVPGGAIPTAPDAAVASDSPYQLRFETDDSGRMAARVERLGDEDLFTEFAYDEGGRLTEVRIEGRPVERYTYDGQARRLHEVNALRGLERDYVYSPDGRLLRAGDTAFEYDDLGMLRSKSTPEGRFEYRYSPDGQLLFVQRPDGVLVEYAHDAYGRRSEKRVAGTVVERYRWNGLTQLVAFEDHNGPAEFEYHRQRMPYAMLRDGKRYWLYYDQIGSLKAVEEVVDDADRIVKALHYDAFGTLLADSNPGFTVPLGYGGGLPDRHTGLVRFGLRDYDPDVGRWTAKDPIGYAGGDNDLYGYCLDDPINGVDPEGLETDGYGAHLGLSGFGFTAGLGGNYVTDDKGGRDLEFNWDWGASSDFGASAELQHSHTNADNVSLLAGESKIAGGTIGKGFYIGADAIKGNGYTGTSQSAGLSYGPPIPFEVHAKQEHSILFSTILNKMNDQETK